MRYIRQFGIILFLSLAGELLGRLIPLPVPASIYGLLLMLLCLGTGLVKVSDVKETSAFLIEIMPLMFIPAAVGIMDSWEMVRENLAAYGAVMVLSTLAVMALSGRVTQGMLRRQKKRGE